MTIPQKIEIWRYADDRLQEIALQLATYIRHRRPIFGWEPSPDQRALKQIVERLNQWMLQSQPKVEWSVAELLATLDEKLASDDRLAPLITPGALGDVMFQPHDGRLIQEATWLRDISRWAQGESFDDVARAASLFDWVIRNVQLDADTDRQPNRPWQVLAYGHGTAVQRAWVFALLCRQQGLDVVMLKVPNAKPQADGSATDGDEIPSEADLWLPALWSDKQLYLFDARLGLPIPGPQGRAAATLAEVRADDSLLRQLDLEDAPYELSAEALGEVTAEIVTDPFDLSRRAAALATKFSGDDRLILASRADELAAELQAAAAVDEVRIWDLPYQIWQAQLRITITARQRWAMSFAPFSRQPLLWKGRVLHFQGRPPAETADEAMGQRRGDHERAVLYYTSKKVRPPNRKIAQMQVPAEQVLHMMAKASASYWVGLLLYDQGKFDAARQWLGDPRLAATVAEDHPWRDGTRYNLARVHEATGEFDEAIALYEQDDSPQRHGNRLRARRLREKQAEAPAADDDVETQSGDVETQSGDDS